jgi:hypothetical protein
VIAMCSFNAGGSSVGQRRLEQNQCGYFFTVRFTESHLSEMVTIYGQCGCFSVSVSAFQISQQLTSHRRPNLWLPS